MGHCSLSVGIIAVVGTRTVETLPHSGTEFWINIWYRFYIGVVYFLSPNTLLPWPEFVHDPDVFVWPEKKTSNLFNSEWDNGAFQLPRFHFLGPYFSCSATTSIESEQALSQSGRKEMYVWKRKTLWIKRLVFVIFHLWVSQGLELSELQALVDSSYLWQAWSSLKERSFISRSSFFPTMHHYPQTTCCPSTPLAHQVYRIGLTGWWLCEDLLAS